MPGQTAVVDQLINSDSPAYRTNFKIRALSVVFVMHLVQNIKHFFVNSILRESLGHHHTVYEDFYLTHLRRLASFICQFIGGHDIGSGPLDYVGSNTQSSVFPLYR